MTGIIGEAFRDYGNTPECVIDRIPAYEVLEDGLIRIFVCKTLNGELVLDHTDIMTKGRLRAIGARLIEIADTASRAPEMLHSKMSGVRAH